MIGKDVLPEKDLLEKAAALKRFEYSPLGSDLEKDTSVAERKSSELNKSFEKEELLRIKKEKPAIISESKLMYDGKYHFSDYKILENILIFLLGRNMINFFHFIIH